MTSTGASSSVVVVTNCLSVAEGKEIDFEDRFRRRAHLVDRAPGFIRNEVQRPTPKEFDHATGRWKAGKAGMYRVSTWWRSFEDFTAWTRSPAFAEAHKNRAPSDMFSGPSKLEVHEVYLSTDAATAGDGARADTANVRVFSPAELLRYRGPGAVYLALRGVVFDVSAGAAFYGPGGAYHCFAGREAGRALARSSLDEADVARGGELGDLSDDELETLAQWEAKFRSKYRAVKRSRARAILCAVTRWPAGPMLPRSTPGRRPGSPPASSSIGPARRRPRAIRARRPPCSPPVKILQRTFLD